MEDRQAHLAYYQSELAYLRAAGAAFARRYPKIAQRLELSDQETPDPHVERMLESFAFLTGRIQYNIDREMAEIPAGMLGVLQPHLLAPIPSMSIARFDVDPLQGKMVGGYTIPRHSQLLAPTRKGQSLRFRTAYPVTLWPIAITEVSLETSEKKFDFLARWPAAMQVLRIKLQALGEAGPDELGLDRLRFHIAGDRGHGFALYELIFAECLDVVLLPEEGGEPVFLGRDSLHEVGFDLDDQVLPGGENEHQGFRLLQEYFVFPDKFLFFDVAGLGGHGAKSGMEIMLVLGGQKQTEIQIDRHSLALGCTPIINLFPKVTDPIRLDETRSEYRLIPDKRLEWLSEIHSIVKVTASSDRNDESRLYQPFFSIGHGLEANPGRAFWLARRRLSEHLDGTDIWLSFVDLDFTPTQPADRVIFAHSLCTNRNAAEQLPAGALLAIESDVPATRIIALNKPTRQITPPLGGQALWHLVSQLSLNHLSLSDNPESLKALKEILTLYGGYDEAGAAQQIAGLREMQCRKVVRRVGRDAWRGFVKGTEVTLTIDQRLFVGSSAYLFAAVLSCFLAHFASVNYFTQLAVRRVGREGLWKTWPPMAGDLAVL